MYNLGGILLPQLGHTIKVKDEEKVKFIQLNGGIGKCYSGGIPYDNLRLGHGIICIMVDAIIESEQRNIF